MDKYNIITIIIMSLALIVNAVMVFLQNRHIKKEYEARRREASLQILAKFIELSSNGLLFTANKLIESLDDEEKRKIIECNQKISLDIKYIHYVKTIICKLNNYAKDCDKCQYKNPQNVIEINLEDLSLIRQAIITYLNALEFIVMAIVNNIAENSILSEQFLYLAVKKEKCIAILKHCNLDKSYKCLCTFLENYHENKVNFLMDKL